MSDPTQYPGPADTDQTPEPAPQPVPAERPDIDQPRPEPAEPTEQPSQTGDRDEA